MATALSRRVLLAGVAAACSPVKDDMLRGQVHSTPKAQPIIHARWITSAAMQAAGWTSQQAADINFPCLFEAPEWAEGLRDLNRYWCFFSNHSGHEIRAAHVAAFDGTLPTILGPSDDISTTLSLTALKALAPVEFAGNQSDNHTGSPDIEIDDENEVLTLLTHDECVDSNIEPITGFRHQASINWSATNLEAQRVRYALLLNALEYEPEDFPTVEDFVAETVQDVPSADVGRVWRRSLLRLQRVAGGGAPHYFRIIRIQIGGVWHWFAISNQGDLLLSKFEGVVDPLGMSPYEYVFADPNDWTGVMTNTSPSVLPRHYGAQFRGDRISTSGLRIATLLYSRPNEVALDGTVPEHIRMVKASFSGTNPAAFQVLSVDAGVTVRRPEESFENAGVGPSNNPGQVSGEKEVELDPCPFPKYVDTNYSGETIMAISLSERAIGLYRLPQGFAA